MAKKGTRTLSTDEENLLLLLDSKNINYIAEFRNGVPAYKFTYNSNEYTYSLTTFDIHKGDAVVGNGLTTLTTELGG